MLNSQCSMPPLCILHCAFSIRAAERRGRRGPAAFRSGWRISVFVLGGAAGKPSAPCVAGSTACRPSMGGHSTRRIDHRNSRLLGVRLLRKEVIQPQVPLRLPCYDFIPITTHTLDGSPLADGPPASGADGFHDVTGGVYKARERIHRSMLTCDY